VTPSFRTRITDASTARAVCAGRDAAIRRREPRPVGRGSREESSGPPGQDRPHAATAAISALTRYHHGGGAAPASHGPELIYRHAETRGSRASAVAP
jgi:hypothetical protein